MHQIQQNLGKDLEKKIVWKQGNELKYTSHFGKPIIFSMLKNSLELLDCFQKQAPGLHTNYMLHYKKPAHLQLQTQTASSGQKYVDKVISR